MRRETVDSLFQLGDRSTFYDLNPCVTSALWRLVVGELIVYAQHRPPLKGRL